MTAPEALILPESTAVRLMQLARTAAPSECCGLLEGGGQGNMIAVTAIHPAANLAPVPGDSFVIDPAVHLALQRDLRGSGRQVVGCFHSHPGGKAAPSPRDRENGCAEGFVWVIIATGVNEALAAFQGPSFQPLAIRSEP